ncbi:MAG: hypothetical protein ACRDO4_00660 [Nocardioides sp.]
MTTTLAVRPEALLDARRVLLRRAQELTGVSLDPPATGATTALTRGVLERVIENVKEVADDLHGLADALSCVVDLTAVADGGVGALLDVLRGQALS